MTSSGSGSVLTVVPAYNAGQHLRELIRRLKPQICWRDLLVINDGSSDNTLEILKELKVNYVSFPVNRGKGAALKAGFDYAVRHNYRSVLTLDADLQHLPEEIPRFLAADDGRRLIIGTREISLRIMPFERWLTNDLTSLIISIFSARRIRDSQSGFRLIPVNVLRAIRLTTTDYDFESEMLFKAGALGCEVAEVPITTVYEDSTSYIHPFKDTLRFIRRIWGRIWA